MPIASPETFPLWFGVPEGWLRSYGRTRVLVIDDQLTKRQDLFAVRSEKALSPEEEQLRQWMNVEIQFLTRPRDYSYSQEEVFPQGTFDTPWFENALNEALQDPRPVAAVLLDLLYGREKRIHNASGPKFLALLRRRLPDIPVLILSNVQETSDVRGMVKEGGGAGEGDVSFQDYLPKDISGGPGLLDRLMEKLLSWADLSDPMLCAFSPAMRRLAREMRRIALSPKMISYQEGNAMLPKPVVIRGPVGSGKNYIANRLHAMSDRCCGPYLKVNFSGHEERDFTTTLFGARAFTGAPQWYRVRAGDAAVLAVMPARGNVPAGDLYLGSLGLIHLVHIADQRPGVNQAPLRGTLLIDEIGTAPETMQPRLLNVFNCGRFTPHLGDYEIPRQGAIDVWFLITLSPEGLGKLRDDLRTRLEAGHELDVPPLRERKGDVLPLALQIVGAGADDPPEQFFNRQAVAELEGLSETIQVRELNNVLKGLSDITAKPPYSGADLKRSADKGRRPFRPPEPNGEGSLTVIPQNNDLQTLVAWCEAREAQFSVDLSERDRLRGKGNKVRGGAAVAILSFLDLCVKANGYSATRTWNYFAGVKGTKAPDARTNLAPFFLIDEAASLDMIRHSEPLLWLAIDVSPRRKEVTALIDRLRIEEGQATRIDRLRSAGEESEE